MAYADTFAAATALAHQAPLPTGDPELPRTRTPHPGVYEDLRSS